MLCFENAPKFEESFTISCIAPLRDSVAVKPFSDVDKLLTKSIMSSTESASPSLVMKPQYQYEANAIEGNDFPDISGKLNEYIENDSSEYKWSPHPETESVDSYESAQDTPEELYSDSDKKGKQLNVLPISVLNCSS